MLFYSWSCSVTRFTVFFPPSAARCHGNASSILSSRFGRLRLPRARSSRAAWCVSSSVRGTVLQWIRILIWKRMPFFFFFQRFLNSPVASLFLHPHRLHNRGRRIFLFPSQLQRRFFNVMLLNVYHDGWRRSAGSRLLCQSSMSPLNPALLARP